MVFSFRFHSKLSSYRQALVALADYFINPSAVCGKMWLFYQDVLLFVLVARLQCIQLLCVVGGTVAASKNPTVLSVLIAKGEV